MNLSIKGMRVSKGINNSISFKKNTIFIPIIIERYIKYYKSITISLYISVLAPTSIENLTFFVKFSLLVFISEGVEPTTSLALPF